MNMPKIGDVVWIDIPECFDAQQVTVAEVIIDDPDHYPYFVATNDQEFDICAIIDNEDDE